MARAGGKEDNFLNLSLRMAFRSEGLTGFQTWPVVPTGDNCDKETHRKASQYGSAIRGNSR